MPTGSMAPPDAPSRHPQDGLHVGLKRAAQEVVGHERVVRVLVALQHVAIDEQRLRVGALELGGAGHQALDGIGDVVRLVEHVGRARTRAPCESASTSSLKTRNSWNGLIEPASRSSSPYLLSLK